jgi:large subunit ribosomal protein L9
MAQKLLLIEDVEALGRSGDIVTVKPGHARNFLIPQGLAIIASKQALRMQARLQEERNQKAVVDRSESEAIAAKLENQTLTKTVKVDHEGHMYGSVNAAEIADLLEKQMSVAIDKRSIQLKHPLKTVGTHTVSAKLKEGVVASFNVSIEAEGKVLSSEKADKKA